MTRVSGSANGQHNPASPSTEAVGLHSQPAQLCRPARRCEIRGSLENRLVLTSGWSNLSIVWSAYADDNPSRPAEPDENAMPGLAPAAAAGLDPGERVGDGASFVVTRRADSPGTHDFDWISHPASYGFTIGANFEWRPDQAELTEEIHKFLAEVDPKTGYLPD